MKRRTIIRLLAGLLALALLVLSVAKLEGARAGLERLAVSAGQTPGTLYRQSDSAGPLVVIAHGFAGSRQLMEAFSLTLAQAGYAVLAFDFQGHGRNSRPMGGDVTSIDGTTRLLVDETRAVIDAGLAATGWQGPVALLGHSMASDIVIRAAIADRRVGPVVAVSMFSQAITPTEPAALLAIAGAWEGRLREQGLNAVHQIDPTATEGQTVVATGVTRRTIAAPMAEHVSVLYSATTLSETRDWLDAFYGRPPSFAAVARTGPWIVLMLASIVALGGVLATALPQRHIADPVPRRTFWLAVLLPLVVVPLVATRIDMPVLPVLVADYLALHLLLYGVVQLAVLWRAGVRLGPLSLLPMLVLTVWCLGVFGFALDRYVASFVPLGLRGLVFAGVALGAVPFMLADALLTAAGHAPLWRRLVARGGFIASLILAVTLDLERLMFLVIILPVIVLFFLVFGLLGRWVGRRSGALPVGLALGGVLAWSLAASFPLFAQ